MPKLTVLVPGEFMSSESAELQAYLDRIGYQGPVDVSVETLRGMHRSHFLNVPFENLDIQRGVPIVLDREQNFRKIVQARRGGFCLELTSLLAWALREIGFSVDLLGARMLSPDGVLSEPLSHMVLLVHLDERWIADVGAGGRFPEPLRLSERAAQVIGPRSFTVANDGDHWLVTGNFPWNRPNQPRTYVFTLQPRELPEFESVCHWLQTSPESDFTRGDIVSRSSETGRTTYSTGRLIVSDGEERLELPVADSEVPGVLRERFGIELPS